MKKLLLSLILVASFLPGLARAEETCAIADCLCTWQAETVTGAQTIGGYSVNVPGTTSEEDCRNQCIGAIGITSADQEDQVYSTFLCKNIQTVVEEVDEPLFPQLNVVIPGLGYMFKDGKPFWSEADITTVNGVQNTNLLGTYIKALYGYLLGAASLVAVTMLTIAGLQYATAGGNSKQVENAKKRIGNAVAGIILLLLAYNIAFLINPATTSFDSLSIEHVKGIEINDETPPNFTEDFEYISVDGPPLKDQKQYAHVAYGPEKCNTGTAGNIKSSGCGVVSFAMAAEALTGQTVDPEYVAEIFYNNGEKPSYRPLNAQGCGENGTYNSAMYENPLIEQYGLAARQIPIRETQELRELVSKGKLIITSYRTSSGGGHYVVISGYTDDGKLIVSNPWGGTREARSEEWWFSTIKSAAYIDTKADFIPE